MTEDNRAMLLLGRLLLPLALALLILSAWLNNPQADGFYNLGKANTLLSAGRYSPAMSLLEQTLKTYQGPQIRLSLSYAYLARRDEARAELQIRIALETASPPLRPQLLAQLGRVLRFAGRNDEALSYLQKAQTEASPYLSSAPVLSASRSAIWHTAMIYWQRADWPSARHTLEALASGTDIYAISARVRLAQLLYPTDNTAAFLLTQQAQTLLPTIITTTVATPNLRVPGLSEGIPSAQIDSILSTLERAHFATANLTVSNSSPAAAATLWGGAYLQMAEYPLAKTYLEQALTLQPAYGPAHARLALALFALGDTSSALSHVNTAITRNPNDPLPHHVLARIYTATSDWTLAKEQLTILTKLQPDSIETHLEWAQFYRLQGEYDQAEDAYIDAVNAQITASVLPPGFALDGITENTNAGVTLARFYTDIRGGGCDKGLPAARQAVALRPDDPAGFDAVGWALVICNRPADALSSLQEAIRRTPDEPRYHFHLGRAYADLARYPEARDQYNITMDLDPTGSWEHLALTELVSLPPT